jgi:uncharacterized protein (TIGR03435 family)
VIDKTKLEGEFDLKLQWNQRLVASTDTAGPPVIFTAIEEQLGLKLESGKGPVEYLVIDHAEKPSEN